MNKDELKALLKEVRFREQMMNCLGVSNAAGRSYDEQLESDINYHTAVIKHREAQLKYQSALNQFITDTEDAKAGTEIDTLLTPKKANVAGTQKGLDLEG